MTGTYYPNPRDIRFEIALDTARRWSEQELPLVVVDGSPDDKVAGALRARGATVLDAQQPGIASQRQEGARYVLQEGGDKIITHEPEKPSTPGIARAVAGCLTTIQLLLSDGRSIQKNQCRHSNGVQKNWLAGCLSVR